MAQPKTFDVDALITTFETATARQGAQLQQTVARATLAALQGRELTLKNIRAVLRTVSQAASTGVARNVVPGVDAAALLDRAVAGIDAAMLRAVQANRTALATLSQQGADLRDKHLQKALADLDRIEDTVFGALKKTAAGAAGPMAAAWGTVLGRLQPGGTQSGQQAATTVEQFADQVQQMLRGSRRTGLRAAQAMAASYGALVSGVLLGMSQALQDGGRGGVAGGGDGDSSGADIGTTGDGAGAGGDGAKGSSRAAVAAPRAGGGARRAGTAGAARKPRAAGSARRSRSAVGVRRPRALANRRAVTTARRARTVATLRRSRVRAAARR